MSLPIVVQVVVDKPLAQGFDYLWDKTILGLDPQIGHVVEVPFSRSSLVGVVIKVSTHSEYEISKLKAVAKVAPLPPIDQAALRLMNFASQYYIHGLGETIIPAIPQMWKKPVNWEKLSAGLLVNDNKGPKKRENDKSLAEGFVSESQLNDVQKTALNQLNDSCPQEGFQVALLQGQTGSGKTAVFLNWLSTLLKDKKSQALILVPEIRSEEHTSELQSH